jgi:hypothetical protein
LQNYIVNKKRVVRICPVSNDRKEYNSISEAHLDNRDKIKYSCYIVSTCSGRQEIAGGYKWQYLDNEKEVVKPDQKDFKIIENFENYSVSSNGEILNTKTNKYITPSVNQGGYLVVDLFANDYDEKKDTSQYTRKRQSKRKKFRVHRLVAQYFLENSSPDILTEVNHKNKIRTDNRVENLEWVSGIQNLQHAHNKCIIKYDLDGNFVKKYDSVQEAAKDNNINYKNISHCLRKGSNSSSGGYRWRYA